VIGSHYIVRCKQCMLVVDQCRCPSDSKQERFVDACADCLAATADTEPAPPPIETRDAKITRIRKQLGKE